MTLEYFKYGRIELHMESGPPVAGQRFGATVVLPAGTIVTGTVSGELACVCVSWERSSKGAPRKVEKDHWVRKQLFGARRRVDGDYVTLQFDLPADQPASDLPEDEGAADVDRHYYRWELRIKADVPGIDFNRTFKLRVAPGAEGAGARPEIAAPPRLSPEIAARLLERIEPRRKAETRLAFVCAMLGAAFFILPFALMGLAAGLAGCPMIPSTAKPPVCEFAGINWGPLVANAFDYLPVIVPTGIAVLTVVYFAGKLWLDRRYQTSSSGWLPGVAVGLVVLAFMGYPVWRIFGPARPVQPVAATAQQPAQAAASASSAGDADRRRPAGAASSWEDPDEEGRLKRALAAAERERGAGHPAVGLAQYRLSQAYERQNRREEQEWALLAALAILEKHPDDAVRKEAGGGGGPVDKEIVARRLGDFYWDQRRYDRGLEYYDRAYRYAREIRASDADLNLRLARSSAGRMATACMLGRWDVADEAMRELKERIVHVDPETRKQLEYWIRTGEPRLAARKC